MNEYVNATYANLPETARDHHEKYAQAHPFPSISFENFFDPDFLDLVLAEFPDLAAQDSIQFNDPKQKKFAGKGEKSFGEKTRAFMHYLNSEPFLEFVQILTGIEEPLVGDPYYFGGGLHEIKRGGLLKVHADFNRHNTTHLDRRVNVLVYLNKDWKEEYGGHFELWDREMKQCEAKILPAFNTLAMFSTTSFSYHGHPDPLQCPEDRSRKSLALYYYTNGRPESEIDEAIGDHTTLFQARSGHADDDTALKHGKFGLKNVVKEITPPFIEKRVKRLLKNSPN